MSDLWVIIMPVKVYDIGPQKMIKLEDYIRVFNDAKKAKEELLKKSIQKMIEDMQKNGKEIGKGKDYGSDTTEQV